MTLSDLGAGKIAAVNTGDTNLAQTIVSQAIKDVANLRGRIGAFQTNVLGSTINSVERGSGETWRALKSAIRDTDFATETANLTRSQILSQGSHERALAGETSAAVSRAQAAPVVAAGIQRTRDKT